MYIYYRFLVCGYHKGFNIEVCIYNKAQKRRERKKRIKKREKIPSWRRKLKLVLHDLVGKNASERE